MPKSKQQKRDILNVLSEKVKGAKAVVFAKFTGLEVKDNEELRRSLRAENSEYCVAKKTLLDIAFKDAKIEGLNIKGLDGQIAAVFGFNDEVAPAKIVAEFKKTHDAKIAFLGGILENRFIDAAQVTALANVPSRQELYAKLVGTLNAPVSNFVGALKGNLRNVVGVLNAISEKK